jgi:hypothetical protein
MRRNKSDRNPKSIDIDGWITVWFRKEPIEVISHPDEIKIEDYENVSGRLPMREFMGPVSIYETYLYPWGDAQRGIKEYDIISFYVEEYLPKNIVESSKHTILIVDEGRAVNDSIMSNHAFATERHKGTKMTLTGIEKEID